MTTLPGAPARPLRILWLKTELLHPVDRGGRIRTYQMLRELRREHHVTYLALDDGQATEAQAAQATEYCHVLHRVPMAPAPRGSWRFYAGVLASLPSRLPYVVWKFRSAALRRRIRELVAADRIDVVVCDFLFPMASVPDDLPCPVVLFQHNVEAVIWKRHLEVARNPLAKAYLRLQWRRMQRFEREACRRVARVVTVSERDERTHAEEYGIAAPAVPTGVDTGFFRPSGTVAPLPHDVVFTGAMDWLPNEDGMEYFVAEVFPRVRAAVPDATLTIVGRNPTSRVRALAEAQPGITVTGGVPDVRPYLERAAVFVVPLRVGGGTRLKIYEALAMAKPVVSTTIGAEGLPLDDGEELLLADDAETFAASVVRLLQYPESATALGRRGAERVRAEFGWRGVAARFAALCATAGVRAPAREAAGSLVSHSAPLHSTIVSG